MKTVHSLSVSLDVKKQNPQLREWVKHITPDMAFKAPADVRSAKDIPGRFWNEGVHRLELGEFLITSRLANIKSKEWGATHTLVYLGGDGQLHRIKPTAAHKQVLKASGMSPELLKGAGQLAACVRLALGLREGLFAAVRPIVVFDEQLTKTDYLTALALKAAWFNPQGPQGEPTPAEVYRHAMLMKEALASSKGEDLDLAGLVEP